MRALLAAIFLNMGTGGMATAEGNTHKGYEAPPYTVEATYGAVELRRYAPHIVAEVTVPGDRDAAIGRGFQILAGYIFGGNDGSAKVAMTTPVAQSEKIAMTTPVMQSGAGAEWVVRFMMPTAYTLVTLPRPKDGRIRFVTTDAARQAVIRFSGIPSTDAIEKQVAMLRKWLADAGLTAATGPHYYFYDAPMTLPWNRRNEVAFTLR